MKSIFIVGPQSQLALTSESSLQDQYLSRFVTVYYAFGALNAAVKICLPMSVTTWNLLSFLFAAVLTGFLAVALRPILNRALLFAIFGEGLFLILFFFSALRGMADAQLLKNMLFQGACVGIPLGLAAYSIIDYSVLIRELRHASGAVVIMVTLALIYSVGKVRYADYSMSLSYYAALPLMIFVDDYLYGKNKVGLFFAAGGSTIILFFGARGPVICILFFTIVEMLKSHLTKVGFFMFFIALLGLGGLLVGLPDILKWLGTVVAHNGINSRTLTLILHNDFWTHDSGRLPLYRFYFSQIHNQPLLGYGIAGGWKAAGLYPHNIFLELFLAFGLPLGLACSLGFIWIIVRAVLHRTDVYGRTTLIFASMTFSLLFSGSFLMFSYFYIFLFLSFKMSRRRHVVSPMCNRTAVNEE